eukprot:10313073-Alexandrium_andersonii.AAC.1
MGDKRGSNCSGGWPFSDAWRSRSGTRGPSANAATLATRSTLGEAIHCFVPLFATMAFDVLE